MATTDPEFYDAPKFTPEPYAPPRRRGCFFYGCIIASVLAVLVLIATAVALYFLYQAFGQLVEEYTTTAPQELPKVEIPAEERRSLKDRVEAFREAIDAGKPTEPLVLTSDDLNALIEEIPELKGMIYATVEGDKVKGQVSIPLERFLDLPILRGRYLNGEAELKASLNQGELLVTLKSFEVNGKRPPEELMAKLRQKNLAESALKGSKNPQFAELIRKLESIEIKDGTIIIRAHGTPGTPADKEEVPDDVLAPPEPDPPKVKAPKGEPTEAQAKPSPTGDPAEKP